MPCRYFVVEWLEDDLESYIVRANSGLKESAEKLRVFNEAVLAVEAIHRNGIFHRDIKASNLRHRWDDEKRVVVAIDMGTAARIDSGYLALSYDAGPVGDLAYSSPESYGRLAGHRRVAPFTDIYGLGCLLFELFNPDHFYRQLEIRNPRIQLTYAAMATLVPINAKPKEQIEGWRAAIEKFGPGFVPVEIDAPGSTVPLAIAAQLNGLLSRLTHVDYERRIADLGAVRAVLWPLIRALENQEIYNRKLARTRELRQKKLAAARERDERFKARKTLTSGKC